jgi:hypothetical protein
MRSFRFVGSAAVCAAVLLGAPSTARAGDAAAAEALFGEAKKLVAQGKYAEACPKFAESNRLDRGAGTLIHLADCYEKNKQAASAWATYKEAASAAQALGRADWEKLANKRATALEPTLAKLTIRVTEPADKIEVTRDGNTVSQASWGTALPIDTGTHTIEAKADGRKPYKTSVTIAKDGEKADVIVPKLEVDAQATAQPVTSPTTGGTTPPPPPPPVVEKESGSQKTIGFIVAGVGVAGVAVGAVTGIMAMSKNNESKDKCPNSGACADKAGVDANDSAKTLGLVSTIGFIAGGVGLAAGAFLILTAGPSRAGVRVVPDAGPKNAGLSLTGSF